MTYCSSSYIVYQWFLGVLNIILLIIGLLFTWKFISNDKKNKKSLPKSIYNLSIIFVVISILLLISFITKTIAECYVTEDVHLRMNNIWSILYVLQWFLLLAILFFRLHSIFNNTAYQLGKCVKRTYGVAFTLMFITFIIGLITAFVINDEALYTICVILLYLIALSISIGITWLFSYKIYRIYQSGKRTDNDDMEQNDNSFITVLARNSVLAFISIGTSLFTTIIYIIIEGSGLNSKNNEIADGIINFCYLIDMASNFMCIMLSFTENNNIYYAICGRIDNYTQSLVSKTNESRVNTPIEPQTLRDIPSTPIPSADSNTQDTNI